MRHVKLLSSHSRTLEIEISISISIRGGNCKDSNKFGLL
jgi:hypothetical protein